MKQCSWRYSHSCVLIQARAVTHKMETVRCYIVDSAIPRDSTRRANIWILSDGYASAFVFHRRVGRACVERRLFWPLRVQITLFFPIPSQLNSSQHLQSRGYWKSTEGRGRFLECPAFRENTLMEAQPAADKIKLQRAVYRFKYIHWYDVRSQR